MTHPLQRGFADVDGEFGTEQFTESAGQTVLRLYDIGWMVSLEIESIGEFENFTRTELDTIGAALAALVLDVHRPADLRSIGLIQRTSPESLFGLGTHARPPGFADYSKSALPSHPTHFDHTWTGWSAFGRSNEN
jgi:hypothetical protein